MKKVLVVFVLCVLCTPLRVHTMSPDDLTHAFIRLIEDTIVPETVLGTPKEFGQVTIVPIVGRVFRIEGGRVSIDGYKTTAHTIQPEAGSGTAGIIPLGLILINRDGEVKVIGLGGESVLKVLDAISSPTTPMSRRLQDHIFQGPAVQKQQTGKTKK